MPVHRVWIYLKVNEGDKWMTVLTHHDSQQFDNEWIHIHRTCDCFLSFCSLSNDVTFLQHYSCCNNSGRARVSPEGGVSTQLNSRGRGQFIIITPPPGKGSFTISAEKKKKQSLAASLSTTIKLDLKAHSNAVVDCGSLMYLLKLNKRSKWQTVKKGDFSECNVAVLMQWDELSWVFPKLFSLQLFHQSAMTTVFNG